MKQAKRVILISGLVAMASFLSLSASAKHHGKKMFEKMDTNADSVIDRDEFMAGAARRFEMMDLDGDGSVTPEEAKEAKRLKREKRRQMRESTRETMRSESDDS